MSYPALSIIIPNFNSELFIKEALDSILAQTWKDFEIIIIDDGSTDNSPNLIKTFQGSTNHQISYLTHPDGRNHGISRTYDLAFKRVSGKCIAILEQDDIWMPDNLAKKMSIIENNSRIGCVYSDIEPFGDNEAEKIRKGVYKNNKLIIANQPIDLYANFIKRNAVMTLSCIVFRKALLDQIFIHTEHNSQFDWLFLSAIAQKTLFYKIPERLVRWRVHKNSYHHQDVVLKKGVIRQFYQLCFLFPLVGTIFKHQKSTVKRLILSIKVAFKLMFLLNDLISAIIVKTFAITYQALFRHRSRS